MAGYEEQGEGGDPSQQQEYWSLHIVFGGLCMFVQRDDGLYVLMPQMKEADMEHDVVCDFRTPDGRLHSVSLDGAVVEFRRDGWHGEGPPEKKHPRLLTSLAPVTEYAGESIDPKWLTVKPGSCLLARVEMPLGTVVRERGKIGKMKLKPGGKKEKLVGLAAVTILVPNSVVEFPIGDRATYRRALDQDEVKLRITHVMPDDRLCPRRECEIKEEDPVPHFHAYYSLVKGKCPLHDHELPELVSDEHVPARRVKCDEMELPLVGESLFFVSPHRCTLAEGT